MRVWLVVVAVVAAACQGLSSSPVAPTKNAAGACTTDVHHQRWDAKNRPVSSRVPERLTVADVLALPVPYVAGWQQATAIDLPIEQRVVRVAGVIRLVKQSPDDCDVHVELGMTGAANAPRIIVEIPLTQPEARQELQAIIGRPVTGTARHYEGVAAMPVAVTGYLFVDLSHQTKAPSRAGHGHGSSRVQTLIEVHPVWRVEKGL